MSRDHACEQCGNGGFNNDKACECEDLRTAAERLQAENWELHVRVRELTLALDEIAEDVPYDDYEDMWRSQCWRAQEALKQIKKPVDPVAEDDGQSPGYPGDTPTPAVPGGAVDAWDEVQDLKAKLAEKDATFKKLHTAFWHVHVGPDRVCADCELDITNDIHKSLKALAATPDCKVKW